MELHEKIDSGLTYGVGIFAVSIPALQRFLEVSTSVFQLLIAIGGFVLVVIRLRHDLSVAKERKDASTSTSRDKTE